MLAYLSINGIILSALLLYFNARKFPSSIYLSIFVFAISLNGITQYIILYSQSVFLTALFITHFAFLFFLTGPAFYLYIRSLLSDNYRRYRKDIWHLVPMTIYLISVIPYCAKPFSEKMAIAEEIVKDPGFLADYKFGWLSELFSVGFVYVSRPLLALCYIVWSIGMVIRFVKRSEDKWVLSGQTFMIKWLYVFMSSSFALVASQFILMFYSWGTDTGDLFYTMNALQILSAIGLIILLVSPFFFPEVIYGLPRLTVQNSGGGTTSENDIAIYDGNIKYSPNFEAAYLDQISRKIETAMQTGQLYTQLDLNMARFSVMVDIPFHHLAYYFREVKNQSFNDFRNDWRINYAKQLIREGKAEELTLEAIGLKSGFTNRSTFFRAFKRAEGIAPAEFLAKMSSNSSSD